MLQLLNSMETLCSLCTSTYYKICVTISSHQMRICMKKKNKILAYLFWYSLCTVDPIFGNVVIVNISRLCKCNFGQIFSFLLLIFELCAINPLYFCWGPNTNYISYILVDISKQSNWPGCQWGLVSYGMIFDVANYFKKFSPSLLDWGAGIMKIECPNW